MINYKLHRHKVHLQGILELQNKNLKGNLCTEEMLKEGYVTLTHNLDVLENMGGEYRHVLAIDNNKVIGYALSTSLDKVVLIPDLKSLVGHVSKLKFRDVYLKDSDYLIMGQICVDIEYRGKEVFSRLYHTMRDQYAKKLPYVITEISSLNKRSIRAHQKVGFREIHRHTNDLDEWIIVLWDWRNL